VDGLVTCPICRVVIGDKHWVMHLRGVHKGSQIKHPAHCPDCGYQNPSQRTMAVHRTQAHGWDTKQAHYELWLSEQQ
jgi:hypothetical protein